MKRGDKKRIDQFVDRHLRLFSATPAQEVLDAKERADHRLRSEPVDHSAQGIEETGAFAAAQFSRRWLAAVSVAAAAAIVLALLLPIIWRSSATAVLEVAARKVQFGEAVRSEIFGEIVRLEDGTRVEMRANSELVLERADDGVRIRLDKGDIVVNAAKQHGHLYVQTKDVMVSVVGTVFYVKAAQEGSRVAVIEGEVHVQQGTTETKLRPGEQVTSNPKMESLPVREEVAWSREAEAHVALLRQATASVAAAQRKGRLAFEVATIRPAAPAAAPTGVNARGGGNAQIDRSCMPGPGHVQLDPRRFNIRSSSLHELVAIAYGPCADVTGRLSGGPEWVRSETWDIEALIPEGSMDPLPTTAYGGPGTELMMNRSPQVQKMIRTLVEERFKVVVRREMKEMPVYVLTVAPGGTKFQGNDFEYGLMTRGAGGAQPSLNSGTAFAGLASAAQGASVVRSQTGPCLSAPGWFNNPGQRQRGQPPCQVFMFLNQFMDQVAVEMSANSFAGRRVINRTDIQERVSFAIDWDPGPFVPGQIPQPLSFQEMVKALERVGLQLKEDPKGAVEFFVIESAERPSEN